MPIRSNNRLSNTTPASDVTSNKETPAKNSLKPLEGSSDLHKINNKSIADLENRVTEGERLHAEVDSLAGIGDHPKLLWDTWQSLNMILYGRGCQTTLIKKEMEGAKQSGDAYQEIIQLPKEFFKVVKETQIHNLMKGSFFSVNLREKESDGKVSSSELSIQWGGLSVDLFAEALNIAGLFGEAAGLIIKNQVLERAELQIKILKQMKEELKPEQAEETQIIEEEIEHLSEFIRVEKEQLSNEWEEFSEQSILTAISASHAAMRAYALAKGRPTQKMSRTFGAVLGTIGVVSLTINVLDSHKEYLEAAKHNENIGDWANLIDKGISVSLRGGQMRASEIDRKKIETHLARMRENEEEGIDEAKAYLDKIKKEFEEISSELISIEGNTRGTDYFIQARKLFSKVLRDKSPEELDRFITEEIEPCKESLHQVQEKLKIAFYKSREVPIDLEEVILARKNALLSQTINSNFIKEFTDTPRQKRLELLNDFLPRAFISKPEDMKAFLDNFNSDRIDENLCAMRYIGAKKAFSKEVQLGIKQLAKNKIKVESKYAKFKKLTTQVAFVMAFIGLVVSFVALTAFPPSALFWVGAGLLGGALIISIIGHMHQYRFQPKTWKATYSYSNIKQHCRKFHKDVLQWRVGWNQIKYSKMHLKKFTYSSKIGRLQAELKREVESNYKPDKSVKKMWKELKISPKLPAREKQKKLNAYIKRTEAGYKKRFSKAEIKLKKLDTKIVPLEKKIELRKAVMRKHRWDDFHSTLRELDGIKHRRRNRNFTKKIIDSLTGLWFFRVAKDRKDLGNNYQSVLEEFPDMIIEMIEKGLVDKATKKVLLREIGLDLEKVNKDTLTQENREQYLYEIKKLVYEFVAMSNSSFKSFLGSRLKAVK